MKKQIALLIALVVAATSVLTAGPVELEPKAVAPAHDHGRRSLALQYRRARLVRLC